MGKFNDLHTHVYLHFRSWRLFSRNERPYQITGIVTHTVAERQTDQSETVDIVVEVSRIDDYDPPKKWLHYSGKSLVWIKLNQFHVIKYETVMWKQTPFFVCAWLLNKVALLSLLVNIYSVAGSMSEYHKMKWQTNKQKKTPHSSNSPNARSLDVTTTSVITLLLLVLFWQGWRKPNMEVAFEISLRGKAALFPVWKMSGLVVPVELALAPSPPLCWMEGRSCSSYSAISWGINITAQFSVCDSSLRYALWCPHG